MKEHFLNYEQSLAVKELGFKENCLANYYVFGDGIARNGMYGQTESYLFMDGEDIEDKCRELRMFAYHEMGVPLKSQFFKWVREKYEINHSIKYFNDEFTKVRYYEWRIHYKGFYGSKNTYEQAEDACINKIIELIKNK